MATGITNYGDISPRTAAFVVKELLSVAYPLEVFGKLMKGQTLPANNTMSLKYRRYSKLPLATTALTEGVTPLSQKLSATDVSLTLAQFGSIVEITDVVADTHEDPVLKVAVERAGEQAIQTLETNRFNTLKAGTNKFYQNGSARTDVNTALTIGTQKKVVRALKRQDAMKMTKLIKSTPDFNTENILPSYIAVGHTDLENDIRAMTGFTDAKDYGHAISPMEGEIGAVNDVRYVLTNICTAYADGGGAKGTMVSTTGVSADVYPVIYLAKDSWDGVALRGKFSIQPTVINPNTPSKSDPLGQRGFVAWKTMSGNVILNDAWMAVVECSCTDL